MFDRRQVMLGSLAGLIAPAAALAQGGPGGAPPPPPPNAGGNVEQLPQINPTDAGQNMMHMIRKKDY